ncbi:PaaI family thioesterase [Croceicoccus ponticola]|uniref:PaaI family thioesterase n=1 Tax=Croceicoccus ponticola TaxID=2217664 RepID=UPI0013E3A265|nr:PaaI family thioesterase [Croceicoccus ponticola]
MGDPGGFNQAVLGEMLARLDDDVTARVRLTPAPHHANLNGLIHGGALMAFIDTAMFAGATLLTGRAHQNGVTVDAQIQFLAPGKLDRPLDALVERTHETGRLLFIRGMLVQGEDRVASFTGLLRKIG